jgi:hypothetical protein
MQTKFVAVSTALILTACSNAPTQNATTSDSTTLGNTNSHEAKEEKYKQIVKASTEAFIASDIDGSAKGFASNVIDYGEGTRPPVKSLDSFKYNLSQFFQAASNIRGENLRYMADQDWVMVWGDWSWIWKSNPANPKGTSKPFRMRGADIFKFNSEGEIAEHYGIIQPMQEPNHSYMTPNQ